MSMTITGADGKEYTIEPHADLNGANLSEANLTNIKYNDDTLWPEGFQPPVSK